MLFALLLLPITLSAAVRDTIRIGNACNAYNAFNISIPIRLPADIDTVHYRWYSNGAPIYSSQWMVTPANRKISYTIPANSGYIGDVAFRFAYSAYEDELDGACEWSPVYVVTFVVADGDCRLTSGAILGAGLLSCVLGSGSIRADGLLGCSMSAGTIGGGIPPDFPPCGMATGGDVVAAGLLSCTFDEGSIVAEGLKGCSMSAGTIGDAGAAPDFPPCGMTAGDVVGAGFLNCTFNEGSVVGAGLMGCSLNPGTIGD